MTIMIAISCAKEAELTTADQAYLFMPDDLQQFDLAAYRFKIYKNGKQYVFLQSRSRLNGLTSGYRATLISKEVPEIIFTTQVNVQSSVGRAKELFEGSKKISSMVGKEYVISLDAKTYQADDLFLLNSKNQYYMVLRKSKLVYSLNIEGTALSEQQVRIGLQKKFANAAKLE